MQGPDSGRIPKNALPAVLLGLFAGVRDGGRRMMIDGKGAFVAEPLRNLGPMRTIRVPEKRRPRDASSDPTLSHGFGCPRNEQCRREPQGGRRPPAQKTEDPIASGRRAPVPAVPDIAKKITIRNDVPEKSGEVSAGSGRAVKGRCVRARSERFMARRIP